MDRVTAAPALVGLRPMLIGTLLTREELHGEPVEKLFSIMVAPSGEEFL